MRTLHSKDHHFVLAKISHDANPELNFYGDVYQHASRNRDQVIFCGRIDSINSNPVENSSETVGTLLLDHLLETKSFLRVEGQYFAIAIIGSKLLAHRSSFCGTSLFYGKRHLSDNLAIVCSHERKAALSPEYLFNFVMDVPGWQFDGRLTPIEEIYRLPSHATLTTKKSSFVINSLDTQPLTHHYNPKQTHEDAGQIVLGHLRVCVKDELLAAEGRNIFSELSGGLDSSFTAALIAETGTPSKSYVYSFPDHPSHQQSIGYATLVAEKFSIPLEIVNGNDIMIPTIHGQMPIGQEPADFYWQGALFGPVIEGICGHNSSIFTGFGADQILNRTPTVLPNLLRTLQLRQFFSVARDMAHDADRSTVNFIWQSLINVLPRALLLRLMGVTIGSSYRPFTVEEISDDIRHFYPIAWLKSGLSYRSRESLSQIFERHVLGHSRFFENCLVNPNLYYLSAPNVVWGGHLGASEIWQHHPFCDSRLIKASFRDISWHLIHNWKSLYKQVLREAQKDILPEELRQRKRDDFSFDGFFLRFLRKNRDTLYEIAHEFSPLLGGHFDKSQFEVVFEQNVFGVQNIETQKLNRFLAYAVWAKNFQEKLPSLPLVDSLPEQT